MSRANNPRQRFLDGTPDLLVELYLYPETGANLPKSINIGWGCPCSRDKSLIEFWDGYPLLDKEMTPGERRRIGFVFMSGSAAVEALATAGLFYLWEGRFIGEAQIVRWRPRLVHNQPAHRAR